MHVGPLFSLNHAKIASSQQEQGAGGALSEPVKWHPEWLPRVLLILPELLRGQSRMRGEEGGDGLWEGGREGERDGEKEGGEGSRLCKWNAHQISKVNPLKRELILYLILLAALSPSFYLCHFSPHPTPTFHLSTPFSFLLLYTYLVFQGIFFKRKWRQQKFSLSSCRQEKVETWSNVFGVCVCVCLSVGWRKADCVGCPFCPRWVSPSPRRKSLTAVVWFLGLSKVIFVCPPCQWMAVD